MILKIITTTSDITSIISLFFVVFAGIFAYFKWKKNFAFKRSNYLYELIEKIYNDSDIMDTIYLIEYKDNWYSKDFHGSKIEYNVDKTLSFFSYICYLKKQKLIIDKEFNLFKYEIYRILNNKNIKDYLFNLYHFSNSKNQEITFFYLFEYGKENKYFNHNFFDNKAYNYDNNYHHYLDF